MADMIISGKTGRRRPAPPRIDLTPMVDLGFLLITFFMLTTMFGDKKAIQIVMPDPTPTRNPTVFRDASTITLLLGANCDIFYYTGNFAPTKIQTITNPKELRNVLTKVKSSLAALPASFPTDSRKLHVLIKPTDKSKYANLVNVLDEMLIGGIDTYAIVPLNAGEKEYFTKIEKKLKLLWK